jgi:hypothetical protein
MEMDERKEPSLRELIAEPITQLLMARDGVDPETVEALVETMRDRLDRSRERDGDA